MKDYKILFPNLNALRFVAALMVVIHHIEQFKDVFHLPNNWSHTIIFNIGKLGVVLFFSLSGFLITYLLLIEKKMAGTVSVGSFYMRRILRIWPLYFLIIIIAIFLLPFIPAFQIPGSELIHDNLFKKVLLFVFFLPNLLLAVYNPIPFAAQTWSIGTEEQFYLFWPWIFKVPINKYVALLVVIVGYIVVDYMLNFLPDGQYVYYLKHFWQYFRIDCMAIGGLFALLFYYRVKSILSFFYNRIVQISVWIITPAMMFFVNNYDVFAVLFSIIIVNLATNKKRIFNIENPATDYLGKISYGLYMYHPIAIVLCLQTLLYFKLYNNIALYILSLLCTIGFSAASYRYFEKPFIRMKTKFSKIVSGENAKA